MKTVNRTASCEWMVGIGLALAAFAASADQMTRPAAGVTRIVFNTPGELVVKPGSEEKLLVEAEAKVLAALDISVKGDTMVLSSKGSFKTDKGLKYTLSIKSFRGLKTEASGSSAVEGFSGSDADVELGGSGDIDLRNMKFGRLAILIKSSGNVEASGGGKTLIARIDGSGNIDTTKYPAQIVEAKLEGSGNIRVHADESLKAAIGGAGNIEYKGKAKVTQSITGAGSVDRI
jgi:putative autotransporter adhesin-like protein